MFTTLEQLLVGYPSDYTPEARVSALLEKYCVNKLTFVFEDKTYDVRWYSHKSVRIFQHPPYNHEPYNSNNFDIFDPGWIYENHPDYPKIIAYLLDIRPFLMTTGGAIV